MERSGGDPVRRGDAVLCDLNPVVGTEQAGVRPVLVVQIDRANTASPHTIIVPFTTRIRQALLPSHVLIPAGVGGLTHDSVVLCEQIQDHGIVVWYDPEQAYSDVVDQLHFPETSMLRYQDSFFALRYCMEPLLECVDRDDVVYACAAGTHLQTAS